MNRTRTKLVLGIDRLSDEGRAFLRAGFCIEENPNHLWMSEYSLLDAIYDSGNGPELDELPEEVWTKLGLSPEDRAEIVDLWRENEMHEVRFE